MRALVLAALLTCAAGARADELRFRDRVLADVSAVCGWRSSIGLDAYAPGFQTVGGGAAVLLGYELTSAFGLFLDGRFLASATAEGTARELLGGVGAQLHIADALRLRAGLSGGTIELPAEVAPLIGIFLVAAVDLLPLGSGRLAVSLQIRVDGNLDVGPRQDFPLGSLALAAGLGIRY